VRTLALVCILSLVLTSLSQCTRQIDQEIEPPENLIPMDEMVDIIVDMRLYDAIIKNKQQQPGSKVNYYRYFLHNSIMEKYDITKEQFESSFNYYLVDINVMDDIYADAITKLSKMKSEVE